MEVVILKSWYLDDGWENLGVFSCPEKAVEAFKKVAVDSGETERDTEELAAILLDEGSCESGYTTYSLEKATVDELIVGLSNNGGEK